MAACANPFEWRKRPFEWRKGPFEAPRIARRRISPSGWRPAARLARTRTSGRVWRFAECAITLGFFHARSVPGYVTAEEVVAAHVLGARIAARAERRALGADVVVTAGSAAPGTSSTDDRRNADAARRLVDDDRLHVGGTKALPERVLLQAKADAEATSARLHIAREREAMLVHDVGAPI